MASWEPERVTFSKKATAGGVFIAACCFAAGFLLLYGQGF